MKTYKLIYLIIIILLLNSIAIIAHKTEVHKYFTGNAVHYISQKNNIPEWFKRELDQHRSQLEQGSYYEDLGREPDIIGNCPGLEQGGWHPYCYHFWTTVNEDASKNSKGLKNSFFTPTSDNRDYWPSAYDRATLLWNKAIEEYKRENKEEAYFLLGKISHLLQDMGVPAHTHNDVHTPVNDESYEDYVGENYLNYRWTDIKKVKTKFSKKSDDLFYLFSQMAEKADDYPSDDVEGEGKNAKAIDMNKKYFK